MNISKISTILLFTLIGFMSSQAQVTSVILAAADRYFASGDYYSAAQYYEQALTGKKSKRPATGYNPYDASATSGKKLATATSTKEQIQFNLGECYRMLHFPEKAVTYYDEVVKSGKDFPLARYHQATALRALGQFDAASEAFKAFREQYKTQDKYSASADMEIQSLAFVKKELERKDLRLFKVERSNQLNGQGGTYAPYWINDKSIMFTSNRPQGKDSSKTNRLYSGVMKDGKPGEITLMNVQQNDNEQQGSSCLTPDGKTMFFTRWKIQANNKAAAIYSCRKSGNEWGEPVMVKVLSQEGSNTQQPFIMPNGKAILFSSDRPGGQGGYDLWMAIMDERGNFGVPVNLGPKINTSGDEQAPSYHDASKSLIFSSNGRVGMGGFDFFYSKGDLNNLTDPVNFGYPVNSVKDELYFISRGPAKNILDDVIMSTDREASCCLELFSLHKDRPKKQISGAVISCTDNQPLGGVAVVIMDTVNNKKVADLITDASGHYTFQMDEFMPVKATGSDSGYFNNSISFAGPQDPEEETFSSPDLCLTRIPNPIQNTVKVDNVYYDYDQASIQEASYASLDALVNLLKENPTLQIEINAHTDSKGEEDYNQKLSDARAASVVNYLVKKGVNKTRLSSKGYGETQPIAENTNADGTDNPEGRQQNRRTEFKVIKL